MDNNNEEYEYMTLEEYEESKTTLNTPDIRYFNLDDSYENLESSSTTESNDIFVPLKEDSDNLTIDHTEWLSIDPHTGRHRPPYQHEFLQRLLENPNYSSYIRWLNKSEGSFQILLPDQVVALWEKVKTRQTSGKMDYQSFSRGLRYYYRTGLMIKTNKKFTYCFNQSRKNISS